MSLVRKIKRNLKKVNTRPFSFIVLFAFVGLAAVLFARAATPITIDASLPVPKNVRAYGDDRNIIVTWDPVGKDYTQVVGYYITYRPKGSSESTG